MEVSMRSCLHARVLVASLCLSAIAAAQGTVLVVSPSGPYTQVWQAVAAASEGDTVLVKPGTYFGFNIEGKGLRVVAQGSVQVSGEVRVAELEAGKLVVLAGLTVQSSSASAHALRTLSNAGALRIQGCVFNGLDNPDWTGPGGGAASIAFDVDTNLVACTLKGGRGANTYAPWSGGFPGTGGTALFTRDAGLALHGCKLTGGKGGSDDDDGNTGGHGGHGLDTPLGTTYVGGCELVGGSGGNGGEPLIASGNKGGDGGPGGHGVFLGSTPPGSADPHLRWRDTLFQGGAGGFGGTGVWGPPGNPGQPGQPIFIANGTEVPLGGPARYLSGAWLVREGQSALLEFTGAPGDKAYLLFEGAPLSSPVPPNAFAAPVLRDPLFCGVIPASGKLSYSLAAGTLAPGIDARLRILRPLFVDPIGDQVVANPFALTIVDQQF
jgi:hypothetical protein